MNMLPGESVRNTSNILKLNTLLPPQEWDEKTKKQLAKLTLDVERSGLTIVPLKFYFNKRGIAKILLGLAKGKKNYDKREVEKKRDWNREKSRLMKSHH